MKGRASWIGMLVVCCIGAGHAANAAPPAVPPAGYTIEDEYTQKSPDGAIVIEQYANKTIDDWGWKWQFWVRRDGTRAQLDPEPADYPADFVFTNDLKWIIRTQKIGSGTATLHLYQITPHGYARAGKKPLGELAWAYLKPRRDWRTLVKPPEYHDSVFLQNGLEQNYRGIGVDWPANRYLVIILSADADVEGRKPMQTRVVNGWRCRYDLQTGEFDVPAVFATRNAKALVPE
jgi:hypothetical protein